MNTIGRTPFLAGVLIVAAGGMLVRPGGVILSRTIRWSSRGVGGGGSLCSPNINPATTIRYALPRGPHVMLSSTRQTSLPAFLALSPFTGREGGTTRQGKETVSVTAKLSQDGVRGGSHFHAALALTVGKGWHINSASPSDENLVATSAAFFPPPGLGVTGVRYPRGAVRKFAFSDTPLDVYEGTVVIMLRINAAAELKPGLYPLPVDISYQACNDDVCLAPVTAKIVIPVRVLAPDVTPVPANPGLFGGSTDE